MTTTTERRFIQGLEVRAVAEGEKNSIGTLVGYAAVYDVRSENLGYFTEIIKPGAFADSLKRGDDVRALVNHNSDMVLGRRSAKTLLLEEDAKGLKVEIQLPDTQAGRDLLFSVNRRDVTGMSFAFRTIEDKWYSETKDSKEMLLRELIKADISEVSPVAFPAYKDTTLEARALSEIVQDGRRRVGKDAHPRRDLLKKLHERRAALWMVK